MTTVAACQIRIDIDVPDTMWRSAALVIQKAASSGADVVVLPELACTGYVFESIAEAASRAEDANGPTARHLRHLSSELGIVLIFGFVERNPDGPRPYNSAELCLPASTSLMRTTSGSVRTMTPWPTYARTWGWRRLSP